MKPAAAKSRGTEVFERQRAALQYHQRVAIVRAMLAQRNVSPDIIDRVIRVNTHLREGERLLGIHYTSMRDGEPVWRGGLVRKGEFLRRYGRQAWARLPKRSITKRGRREYVTREAIVDRQFAA
jgi:hypothetical protein